MTLDYADDYCPEPDEAEAWWGQGDQRVYSIENRGDDASRKRRAWRSFVYSRWLWRRAWRANSER